MKRKISKPSKRAFLIISLLILAVSGLAACGKERDYPAAIKRSWDIELPDQMTEELFESDIGLAGQGDGVCYAVFKLSTEPTDFLLSFSKNTDESFKEFTSALSSELSYAEYELPENFVPNWETVCYWKYMGQDQNGQKTESLTNEYHDLYMAYFPESLRLIVCESFG